MVTEYPFSAEPFVKRFCRSRLARAHISEAVRKNVFLFSIFGALKETQKLCAICLVRVSGCRKLEWVNVNDFMGNGRWVEGRKLAGCGWNPVVYVEVFGSPESSLSRLLWTHKNVPETEFGFLLDLTAALIAPELLQSKPPSKPTTVEWKCYAPKHAVILHVVSYVTASHGWKTQTSLYRERFLSVSIWLHTRHSAVHFWLNGPTCDFLKLSNSFRDVDDQKWLVFDFV